MCGIAGIVGKINPRDRTVVESMNAIQSHRGPDMDKVCEFDGAVLGHRRLSIIDLDDRSSQPMVSGDGRYVIVFNGEIYNYKELKSDLKKHYEFKTESDTEVLLAAYIIWGKECLLKFIGMFAFCIYDTRKQETFLARDFFGQKPLFFHEDNDCLIFASEIKAILTAGVEPVPNYETWSRYLVSASYDDDDSTFFKSISQLLPGEYATWDTNNGFYRHKYFNLPKAVGRNRVGTGEAALAIRELLVNSARLHMRSDVPVGLALSGGLDSSTLLACLDYAGELNEKLECLSFEFEDSISEASWIEAATLYHGLQSTFEVFTREDFVYDIKSLMWHLEAPIGGLANCALAKLMSRASQMGLKVIQDGTGLDEAFAGYRNHHNLFLGSMIAKNDASAKKYLNEFADFWSVTKNEAERLAMDELENTVTSIDGTIPVRVDLLNPDFKSEYNGAMRKNYSTGSKLYDQLIDYLQTRKIPRNTRMKDRVSMAYSIELRLPFLEHNLIDYALGLPEHYHFLYGRTKSIIREAMKGYMDEDVRIAPKRSIQAPQGEWLREAPMCDYIKGLINSESFGDRGVFDINRVKNAYREFCTGMYENSFFVWQWINLEEWFRTFIDSDSTKDIYPLYN